jgi:hypothetical protein
MLVGEVVRQPAGQFVRVADDHGEAGFHRLTADLEGVGEVRQRKVVAALDVLQQLAGNSL